jgi:hypothetical protein
MHQIGMTATEIAKFLNENANNPDLLEVVTELILANNRKITADLVRLGVLMGSITSGEGTASF